MYCRNCGSEIPGDAKFCPECGAKVIRVENTGETKAPEESPAEKGFVDFDTEKAPDEKKIFNFKWDTEDFHREPRKRPEQRIEWGDLLGVKAKEDASDNVEKAEETPAGTEPEAEAKIEESQPAGDFEPQRTESPDVSEQEKFQTFSQKNAAFQDLLDRERKRVQAAKAEREKYAQELGLFDEGKEKEQEEISEELIDQVERTLRPTAEPEIPLIKDLTENIQTVDDLPTDEPMTGEPIAAAEAVLDIRQRKEEKQQGEAPVRQRETVSFAEGKDGFEYRWTGPAYTKESEPVPAQESKPEPESAPAYAKGSEPEPVPAQESKSESEPKPAPEYVKEPEPEPVSAPAYAKGSEPEPVPAQEPKSESEPESAPAHVKEPEPEPVSAPEPKPAPAPGSFAARVAAYEAQQREKQTAEAQNEPPATAVKEERFDQIKEMEKARQNLFADGEKAEPAPAEKAESEPVPEPVIESIPEPPEEKVRKEPAQRPTQQISREEFQEFLKKAEEQFNFNVIDESIGDEGEREEPIEEVVIPTASEQEKPEDAYVPVYEKPVYKDYHGTAFDDEKEPEPPAVEPEAETKPVTVEGLEEKTATAPVPPAPSDTEEEVAMTSVEQIFNEVPDKAPETEKPKQSRIRRKSRPVTGEFHLGDFEDDNFWSEEVVHEGMNDSDNPEVLDTIEKKSGGSKVLTVLIVILAVILVLQLGILVIRFQFPDSGVAQVIEPVMTKIENWIMNLFG